ncbi:MAG: hypothetical protein Q8N08_02020 [Methanobacteriaceae archaeon]|nr:hypothetical protein [Methanobacteriaceae archaeon]
MYSKLVGVISIRGGSERFLFDVFSELSIICEKIIVNDKYNLLSDFDNKILVEMFDADVYKSGVVDLSIYGPEWVLTLYDDETVSKQFRYMKDSLCCNEYVNIWKARILNLWNDDKHYREDKLWGEQTLPIMYKWIPEINYKFKKGDLVPYNQPGTAENCGVPIISYRHLTSEQRAKLYKEYLEEKEKLNYVTKLHYQSLIDKQGITLKKLVD